MATARIIVAEVLAQPDLLALILEHLTARSLLNLGEASRRFTVSPDSPYWKRLCRERWESWPLAVGGFAATGDDVPPLSEALVVRMGAARQQVSELRKKELAAGSALGDLKRKVKEASAASALELKQAQMVYDEASRAFEIAWDQAWPRELFEQPSLARFGVSWMRRFMLITTSQPQCGVSSGDSVRSILSDIIGAVVCGAHHTGSTTLAQQCHRVADAYAWASNAKRSAGYPAFSWVADNFAVRHILGREQIPTTTTLEQILKTTLRQILNILNREQILNRELYQERMAIVCASGAEDEPWDPRSFRLEDWVDLGVTRAVAAEIADVVACRLVAQCYEFYVDICSPDGMLLCSSAAACEMGETDTLTIEPSSNEPGGCSVQPPLGFYTIPVSHRDVADGGVWDIHDDAAMLLYVWVRRKHDGRVAHLCSIQYEMDLDGLAMDDTGGELGAEITVSGLRHKVATPAWLARSDLEGDLVVNSQLWMFPRGEWPGRPNDLVPDDLIDDIASEDQDGGGGGDQGGGDGEILNGLSRRERLRIKAWPISSIVLYFGLADGNDSDSDTDLRPHQVASILRGGGPTGGHLDWV